MVVKKVNIPLGQGKGWYSPWERARVRELITGRWRRDGGSGVDGEKHRTNDAGRERGRMRGEDVMGWRGV